MPDFITNDLAKVQTIGCIRNFYQYSNTSNDIMTHIIRNGYSDSIKLVICLHLIIMFKNVEQLSLYLENIRDVHGDIACEFMVNYTIQHGPIFVSDQEPILSSNSINAFTCAALWNTDPRVISILMRYGADINSMNESGIYSDEISERFPYYNHLIPFLEQAHQMKLLGTNQVCFLPLKHLQEEFLLLLAENI